MTTVTAEQIKNLRETTGAGMLDCRKALTENNGNMEEAIDWLAAVGYERNTSFQRSDEHATSLCGKHS